jgi:parvulin-like peptidyl-prolyl isomerase
MKPLSLLALPSLLVLATSSSAEVIERVVAKVNGDIVTLSEFEARQIAAVQMARIGPERVEAFLRESNARILQEAIDDLLIMQRAMELEIKLPPTYVKEVIEGIKKENNLASDDVLREQLRREGMTLDDMKRNIMRQILKRQVLQRELEPKIAVTESDVRADYEARKEEYSRPSTVHLQEILVPAEAADARSQAAEIVRRARAGEDFTELARAHSASPTRSAGGDLGTVNLKELSPTVQKAAAPLQPSEVSDPVLSPEGYRIFKLVERSEASVVPFEEVKADIRRRLMDARGNEAYETYVEGLRKTGIVTVQVKEVPLQVSRPVTPSTLLEPPLPEDLGTTGTGVTPARPLQGPAAPAPAEEAPEFSTTPQAAPERVVPAPPDASKPDASKKDEDDSTPQ